MVYSIQDKRTTPFIPVGLHRFTKYAHMQICTNFTDSKMTAVDLFVGHHNKQLSDVIFMSFC